jgi:predicted esterase
MSQPKLPDADEARLKLFQAVELHFAPYIFAGSRFPSCDFEQPSLVEELIGSYTIRTAFYDAGYRPVTSAERAGRYGAVVEIEAASGRIFKRFRTLFRRPDPADGRIFQPVRPHVRMSQPEPVWYGRKGPFPVELPEELGIDPQVVREQGTTLYEYFRGRLQDGYWDDPWTAILLAGLYETAPGDGDLRRNNAWERDRRWWFGLKQRTGDAQMPHLLYLPREYDQDTEKRWPLVLFLHGSGEIGDDLDQVRKSGLAKLAEEGRPFPFLLLAPQCPEEEWFWSPAALNALLDDVSARCRVDPDRVYVTGLSMGGRGTWVLAIAYPDRFAAIAPICGSIPEPEEASRIRHLPVWAFLGAKDEDPSIRQMVAALEATGGNVRLTVYPDAGHNAWTPTYANPAFYEWLLSHRRTSRPS